MGDRDSDRPTPRESVTGTWQAYRDQATSMALRLKFAASAKKGPGSSSNPRLRDLEGAGRFEERAKLFQWLADQFSLWPSDPEKWYVERITLGPLFTRLFAESLAELAAMPKRSDGGAW